MVNRKVVIKNPTGLHLRPAGILCKEAMKFKGKKVNVLVNSRVGRLLIVLE